MSQRRIVRSSPPAKTQPRRRSRRSFDAAPIPREGWNPDKIESARQPAAVNLSAEFHSRSAAYSAAKSQIRMLIWSAGLSSSNRRQERTERDRQAVVRAAGWSDQRRFAVNIPANDVHLPLGKQQRALSAAKYSEASFRTASLEASQRLQTV